MLDHSIILAPLLAFTVAAGLLTITPGLDTALVVRTAAVDGARSALLAGLGVSAGVLVWGLAASAGLGALLAASQLAYDAVRIAGAVYLVVLGARMILRPRRDGLVTSGEAVATEEGSSRRTAFLRGLLTNLLNPKVGVFYVTFLPQFVPAGVPVVPFSVLLAGLHVTMGMVWFVVLVAATRPLARWLSRPAVATALDRVTGGIFLAFGLRLALERR
ncbi:LysE family translocator [Segnochrobactrum spirostomi]|uniref:LysE family translocator n=1 Tax=Segnochrobactrum spirostomi TaxID=2608987 RepID=A0A6A7Y504_9HYPH|nr:LysE family translocator [Segnochrobactrum spirostomi]MQT13268.1 LysE family translocator [Segnochrobactrum spirostomi]